MKATNSKRWNFNRIIQEDVPLGFSFTVLTFVVFFCSFTEIKQCGDFTTNVPTTAMASIVTEAALSGTPIRVEKDLSGPEFSRVTVNGCGANIVSKGVTGFTGNEDAEINKIRVLAALNSGNVSDLRVR